ncbi:MAG: hypothetical protein ABIR32_16135 [Ilumatobacteraceae bacterium]
MRNRLMLTMALVSGTLVSFGALTTVATSDVPVSAAAGPGVRYIDEIFATTISTTDLEYAVAPALITGRRRPIWLSTCRPT